VTARPRWPADVKARAVALCGEKGAKFAAEELGVPQGTIRSWVHRSVADATAATSFAPAVRSAVSLDRAQPWPARRGAVVRELSEALGEVIDKSREAVRDGRLRDARDGFTSTGILVDKLQLLSGDATSRTEQHRLSSPADRVFVENEIRELEAELDELGS
jgi:transposase-like protein